MNSKYKGKITWLTQNSSVTGPSRKVPMVLKGVGSIKDALIAALNLLFLSCVVQAQVTSLTHMSTYDNGEIIVSYYEYLAEGCPDYRACQLTKTVNTPGRIQQTRVAAVIIGAAGINSPFRVQCRWSAAADL